MPTGQNWINFIYVNLGFVAHVLFYGINRN